MTVTATQSHAQRIRAGLKHPVVDEDGHLLESLSLLMPYLDKLYTDPAAPIFEYADAGIVWHTAKATIKHLRAAGGGSMIITNSVCGLKGMPNIGHYVCPGCRHAMFRMPSSDWPPTNPAW